MQAAELLREIVEQRRRSQAAQERAIESLTPTQAALLRRLAYFQGGFTAGAASAVAGARPATMQALIDKALVVPASTGGWDKPARNEMPVFVRGVAHRRLTSSPDHAAVAGRHLVWCVGLVEAAEPEMRGPQQCKALSRIDAELANIDLAFRWGARRREAAVDVLRLVGALGVYWRVRGRFQEGLAWSQVALVDVEADAVSPDVLARALWTCGFMHHMVGHNEAAAADLELSAELYHRAGDPDGLARATFLLGSALVFGNRRGDGLPLLQVAAEQASNGADAWTQAHALVVAGHALRKEGDFGRADRLLQRAAHVAREAREPQGLRYALLAQADAAFRHGHYADAERLASEAQSVNFAIGDVYDMGAALCQRAQIAMCTGRLDVARQLFGYAVSVFERAGIRSAGAGARAGLATLALAESDVRAARFEFETALAAEGDLSRASASMPMRGLANVHLARNELDSAETLLDRAGHMDGAADDRRELSFDFHVAAAIARRRGNRDRASELADMALAGFSELSEPRYVAMSLETVAGLAMDQGRPADAVRLLSGADTILASTGDQRFPSEQRQHDSNVEHLRQRLPAEVFERAWASGTTVTVANAPAFASSLAS